MAATILAKDALWRVSSQLTDAAPQFTRWTERELVNWLNDAQKAVAKFLPPSCARIDSIQLANGTKQSIDTITAARILNGDGSTSVDVYGKMLLDVIRNMGSDGATPGRAIRVVSRDVLDVATPNWHSSTGSPVTEYVFDPRNPTVFYVTPGVSGTSWVEIAWIVSPTEIAYSAGSMLVGGGSTVKLSIDDQYIDDLVNYILARAHMKEAEVSGNYQLASAHSNLFTASINAQAKAITGVNPNLQALPFTPAVPGAAR